MNDFFKNLVLIFNQSKRVFLSAIFFWYLLSIVALYLFINIFNQILGLVFSQSVIQSPEVVTGIFSIASYIAFWFLFIFFGFLAQKKQEDDRDKETLTDAMLDFFIAKWEDGGYKKSDIIDWIEKEYSGYHYKRNGIQPSDFTEKANKQGNRKAILESAGHGMYKLSNLWKKEIKKRPDFKTTKE